MHLIFPSSVGSFFDLWFKNGWCLVWRQRMEQDCQAVVFISPDPLHVPPPCLPASTLPPLLSHVDAASAAWVGNKKINIKRASSVHCPLFFPLPTQPMLHTSAFLLLWFSSFFFILMVFLLLLFCCLQGRRQSSHAVLALCDWVKGLCQTLFVISELNCFS